MNGITKALFAIVVAMLVGCAPVNQDELDVTEMEMDPEPVVEMYSEPACTLVMGFESWEPYQYTNVNGDMGGVDIEIAQRAAAHIGCVLRAQQGTWRDLLIWLQEGEIDLVMGASLTPSRLEYAHFSIPYRDEQFSLFIRSAEARRHTMDSIEEFLAEGLRVGIVNEYFYGEEMQVLMYESEYASQFVGARLNELNMARLLDGDIDGFMEDNLVAASIIRRRGLADLITRHEISLPASEVYVMFSRSAVTEAEVDEFNLALQALIDSGFIDELITRYGG